ncbi:GNAT family N-acetyltransferase [Aspergillus alliaceus]|uniref:GNAT family N-acetyltransferase n=1 Tax=Petromyces alliaceus TaxID=209559 RepID=UPI0012A6ECFC|nr:uncharacterized protein BDW43DRAFT_313204 [Aspergillus alliaceus]KAB8231395.1 hypothetical protein BDW43DRAFT_313204 [Aspergillus alliaceus]
MRLRQARQSDLAALALIQARAFVNDPVFAHFHPFRRHYPQDYYNSLLQALKLAFVTPGNVIMVALLEQKDLGFHDDKHYLGSKLAGFISCVRHGRPKDVDKWNPDDDAKCLERQLYEIETGATPNRAVSTGNIQDFYGRASLVLGSQSDWVESLMLAVLPEYQHLGVAKQLMLWEIAAAEEEGVDIFFEATEVSAPIYLRMGAKVLGTVELQQKKQRSEIQLDEVDLPACSVPVMRLHPSKVQWKL